jgi:hypothetical protein
MAMELSIIIKVESIVEIGRTTKCMEKAPSITQMAGLLIKEIGAMIHSVGKASFTTRIPLSLSNLMITHALINQRNVGSTMKDHFTTTINGAKVPCF